MADIFGSIAPGTVAVARTPGIGGGNMVRVSGAGGDLAASQNVLVHRVSIGQGVNLQMTPALDGHVYVYGFGDRIGQVTVSGITFTNTCDGGQDGLGTVLNFYSGSRAVHDTMTRVSIAGTGISGFLKDVEAGKDNPELQLGFYTMILATVPEMSRT